MKIVYLLPGGLFNSGGMERVVSIKANYLSDKMGYDVSIVTTEQMGRPVYYPLSEKVQLYHLNIGIHEKFGKESYIEKCVSRYLKTKEYKKVLRKLLAEIRPDIIISTLGGLDIGFLNDLQKNSIKIGELHFPGNYRQLMARKLSSAFIPNLVAKFRTQSFKRNCGKLSRLVVLTEEEKSLWKNQQSIEVIPNPISFFPSESSSLQSKKVIAIGRLVYEKGFDLLIETWKYVVDKHPDWELNIYGNGNQKDHLLRIIQKNHLELQVKIHDPVKNIQEQYLDSSLFVLSSRYLEALPMVMLEAMACGLPLVAFDAPCGPKDIITNGVNGFLVKTGDIKTLSEKIIQLIESEELRQEMGKASKQRASDFQVEKIMKLWVDLFQNEHKRNHI
jgi:glycosyltransferase involved in cell wall biosynthesis